MKAYLLGIVAAAFLVSLLNALGGSGAGQGTRKLVGAFLLMLAVFRPLGQLEISVPEPADFSLEAELAAASGISQAEQMKALRITEGCEAYILTKAAELGLESEIDLTLNEQGLPGSVTIRCAAAPGERQALTEVIVRELGIEKEAVTWMDPYESSESTTSCEHTNIPS